jgi:hypothetical protein
LGLTCGAARGAGSASRVATLLDEERKESPWRATGVVAAARSFGACGPDARGIAGVGEPEARAADEVAGIPGMGEGAAGAAGTLWGRPGAGLEATASREAAGL